MMIISYRNILSKLENYIADEFEIDKISKILMKQAECIMDLPDDNCQMKKEL